MTQPHSFHLLGIAGTGMGAFAGLLKQAGYEVRGSDENVYPPMSHKLQDWGIETRTPYRPENLDPAVDLVVVGNVIRRINVEATTMRERGLPHASFPATLGEIFLKNRHAVVVAGTHGKTTTSTLLAHTLLAAGRDPGFLIGGIPQGLEESFRVGGRAAHTPFVVEGDEYDTAYFDKGPKFLHYHPRSLLCTSLEFDHADIYESVEQIQARFQEVMALVPDDGHVVIFAGDPALVRAKAAAHIRAQADTYGDPDSGADWTYGDLRESLHGIECRMVHGGVDQGALFVPLSGVHGARNATGAYAILRRLGLSHDEIRQGFSSFAGVKRRMEVIGEASGVVVIDDFAHHPTAVSTTLAGAKRRFGARPLWALFEPRSATSCRKIFQDAYAAAFDAADRILLAPTGRELPKDEALDVDALVQALYARGKIAEAPGSIDAMVERVRAESPRDAVLLCMSNGAFGGIHHKLLQALATR